jgi:hypothetical protein
MYDYTKVRLVIYAMPILAMASSVSTLYIAMYSQRTAQKLLQGADRELALHVPYEANRCDCVGMPLNACY